MTHWFHVFVCAELFKPGDCLFVCLLPIGDVLADHCRLVVPSLCLICVVSWGPPTETPLLVSY